MSNITDITTGEIIPSIAPKQESYGPTEGMGALLLFAHPIAQHFGPALLNATRNFLQTAQTQNLRGNTSRRLASTKTTELEESWEATKYGNVVATFKLEAANLEGKDSTCIQDQLTIPSNWGLPETISELAKYYPLPGAQNKSMDNANHDTQITWSTNKEAINTKLTEIVRICFNSMTPVPTPAPIPVINDDDGSITPPSKDPDLHTPKETKVLTILPGTFLVLYAIGLGCQNYQNNQKIQRATDQGDQIQIDEAKKNAVDNLKYINHAAGIGAMPLLGYIAFKKPFEPLLLLFLATRTLELSPVRGVATFIGNKISKCLPKDENEDNKGYKQYLPEHLDVHTPTVQAAKNAGLLLNLVITGAFQCGNLEEKNTIVKNIKILIGAFDPNLFQTLGECYEQWKPPHLAWDFRNTRELIIAVTALISSIYFARTMPNQADDHSVQTNLSMIFATAVINHVMKNFLNKSREPLAGLGTNLKNLICNPQCSLAILQLYYARTLEEQGPYAKSKDEHGRKVLFELLCAFAAVSLANTETLDIAAQALQKAVQECSRCWRDSTGQQNRNARPQPGGGHADDLEEGLIPLATAPVNPTLPASTPNLAQDTTQPPASTTPVSTAQLEAAEAKHKAAKAEAEYKALVARREAQSNTPTDS